jgi:homoserine kinase
MVFKKKNPTPAKSLELILPATSANLGPAFDAAALAFGLYLRVGATAAPEFSVRASGRDEAVCGKADNHLIITTYCEVLQAVGKPIVPLALALRNEMPIGKGCGSSAAARLAGIAMAVHFGGLRWKDRQIIGEASRREHHPDNAAACWVGGLAVAKMSGDAEAQVVKVRPKGQWPLLFAVPEEALSTEQARRVLPAQYSRADTVSNVQNSMLLLMAFVEKQYDLLATALQDRIHQPYRERLCPLFPALRELTGRQGVLGVALSGAGPSVLIFLDPRVPAKTSRSAIGAYLANRGLKAELISTSIAPVGAGGQRGWRKAHPGSRYPVR